MELIFLATISDRKLTGVEIKNACERYTEAQLSKGSLYVVLGRLVKGGYIKDVANTEGDRREHYFTITEKGKKVLEKGVAYFAKLVIDAEELRTNPSLDTTPNNAPGRRGR